MALWQRMHRDRRGLIARSFKLVSWAEAGGPAGWYLFEVCEWPPGIGERWCFMCWLTDGTGAWWKDFRSLRAAMAFYRQPVEAVMQMRHDSTVQGVFISRPKQGVSLSH